MQRYNDTDLLHELLIASPTGSAAAAAACARLNDIHGHYPISVGDLVYTLSIFALDAVDAINTYGWRRVLPQEAAAVLLAWRRLGEEMHMDAQRSGHLAAATASWTALRAWRTAYETQHMKFTREAFRLTEDSVTLFRFHPAVSPALTLAAALSFPLRRLAAAAGFGRSRERPTWEGERWAWFSAFDHGILRPVIVAATTPRLHVALGLARPSSTAQLGGALRDECLERGLHGRQLRGGALAACRHVSPKGAADALFNARKRASGGSGGVQAAALEAHLPLPPWTNMATAQREFLHFDTQTDCALVAAEAACGGAAGRNTDCSGSDQQRTKPRRRGSSADGFGWGGGMGSPGGSNCATAGWGGEQAEFELNDAHCDALELPQPVHASVCVRWTLALALLAVAAVQRMACFPRCAGGCSTQRSPLGGVRPGCPMSSSDAVHAVAGTVFMERFARYGAEACPQSIGSIGPEHMRPLQMKRTAPQQPRARSVRNRGNPSR